MAKRTKRLTSQEDGYDEIRINKFLSESGVCSRREADRYIIEGKVKIDGEIAQMGSKVTKDSIVTFLEKPIKREEKLVLIAFNKPEGIVCTTDQREPDNIIDFIKYGMRIYPIGRLDKDSEGLILLTNDGNIVNKILRAEHQHEKEYVVRVNKEITAEFLQEMSSGVPILDTVTNPCTITQLDKNTFNIILTQGLNRQIRRMCEHLGYRVVALTRIRIMNIQLGRLKAGDYRNVTEKEIEELSQTFQQQTEHKAEKIKHKTIVRDKSKFDKSKFEKSRYEKIKFGMVKYDKAKNEKTEPEKVKYVKVNFEKAESEKVKYDKSKSEKPEPNKVKYVKVNYEKSESEKAKYDKSKSEKSEPEKAKFGKTKYEKSESEKAKYGKSKSEKSEPNKSKYNKAKYEKTEPNKVKYVKAKYEKTEPEKVKYDKTKYEKTEPDKAKYDKDKYEKSEPAKLKYGKTKYGKPDHNKDRYEKTKNEKSGSDKVIYNKSNHEKLDSDKAKYGKSKYEKTDLDKSKQGKSGHGQLKYEKDRQGKNINERREEAKGGRSKQQFEKERVSLSDRKNTRGNQPRKLNSDHPKENNTSEKNEFRGKNKVSVHFSKDDRRRSPKEYSGQGKRNTSSKRSKFR